MGCTASRTDIQLGKIDPWVYKENGSQVDIPEEDLQKKREEFWKNRTGGNANVWEELHKCCNYVLSGNDQAAELILSQFHITVISGELSLVQDSDGNSYSIDKYCYSNPSNMKKKEKQEEPIVAPSEPFNNNKFRFRIGSSFLDEEREIIFIFDDESTNAVEEEKPKEHSPENHMYFHTYHFKKNLQTITELEVRDLVLETIKNFPEVKDKLTITNLRLFYLGRELNRTSPFIQNHIPYECVIVVLVQYV